jgi:hypothetical protein
MSAGASVGWSARGGSAKPYWCSPEGFDRVKLSSYELQIGRWHVTWFDLWTGRWCLEVAREPRG